MSKKIETMDMETGFIEEEFQDGEEEGDLSTEYDNWWKWNGDSF